MSHRCLWAAMLFLAACDAQPAGPQRPELKVDIGTNNLVLALGDTLRLAPVVFGGNPRLMPIVQLRSSNPAIAEIGQDGLVRAHLPGSAVLHAVASAGSAVAFDSIQLQVVRPFVTDSAAYTFEFTTSTLQNGQRQRRALLDVSIRYVHPFSTSAYVYSYCGDEHFLWGDELQKRVNGVWVKAVDVAGGGLCVFPTLIALGETLRYRWELSLPSDTSQFRMVHPPGGEYRFVLRAFKTWSASAGPGATLPEETRATNSFLLHVKN